MARMSPLANFSRLVSSLGVQHQIIHAYAATGRAWRARATAEQRHEPTNPSPTAGHAHKQIGDKEQLEHVLGHERRQDERALELGVGDEELRKKL